MYISLLYEFMKNSNKEKEKKKRKGRVACRKEGGSFLLFKVRLRVIYKKKKNREKEELEREAPSSL